MYNINKQHIIISPYLSSFFILNEHNHNSMYEIPKVQLTKH